MCGPTGNVGFAGLFIQQFSAATDPSFVNTQAPALDANVMLTPPVYMICIAFVILHKKYAGRRQNDFKVLYA